MTWAILTGIQGNLTAYNAVLTDLQTLPTPLTALYLLGDIIGPNPDNPKLIDRLQQPHPHDLTPQLCQGWWEEQALILYGVGQTGDPVELIQDYGKPMAKTLWDAVPRDLLPWLTNLEFGFIEQDSLLIHGSTVHVAEKLTPETPPVLLLDRLQRNQVNRLFCGRSGRTFCCELSNARLEDQITTLTGPHPSTITTAPTQKIIGVGTVSPRPGDPPSPATYVLFDPETDRLEYRTVPYRFR